MKNLKAKPTFEQTWQVNGYSMLSMDLGVTYPFNTIKQQLCSFVDKNWIFVSENNVGSMYYSKEEMELAAYWGKYDFLNKKWFNDYIFQSKKLYKISQELFEKYSSSFLEKSDKDTLYLTTREVGLTLAEIYGYFNTCQPQCVAYLEKDLEAELKKSTNADQVRELMLELTRPESLTLLDEEDINWLKLISNSNPKTLEKSFANHAIKYGILGTSDGGDMYTAAYYKKQYNKTSQKEAKERLKKKTAEFNSIKKNKQSLIKKYKVSKQAIVLAEILAVTGHERFELRLRGWMPLDFWFTKILLPHLEKRFGLTSRLLRQMTFQELLNYILTGQADEPELEEKHRMFVVGMRNGNIFLRTGNAAKEYLGKTLVDDTQQIQELKGQVAKKGLVKGSAYVLQWNETDIVQEMENMPKGTILVAGQTRPQLMPAIRKASAIVTDEGGITSHAAIVARELGIPTVIGTKSATKVFKTGDKLEVDANNGIVKLLKRN